MVQGWNKLGEESQRELLFAEYLVNQNIQFPMAILALGKITEREIWKILFNQFKLKICTISIPERLDILEQDKIFHQISYSIFWKYVYEDKPLTLGVFGRILATLDHFKRRKMLSEVNLFGEIIDEMVDIYGSTQVVDLVISTVRRVDEKNFLNNSKSLVELRNFVAHPNEVSGDMLVSKELYTQVKDYILGENGILTKIL